MPYTSGRLIAGSTNLDTNAAPISSTAHAIRETLVQADPANSTNVLVGDVSSQTIVLTPGASMTVPIISLSRIYAKMASGTGTVNWFARD